MFETFTTDARAIVERAREEAQGLGHGFIGTEHLVLGGAEAAGLDADALRSEIAQAGLDRDALATIGIDLDAVRERVESAFGQGALSGRRAHSGRTPFTARAKKALQLTIHEAVADGSGEIRDVHLLRGVLAEGEGLGARLLAAHGVTVDRLR